MDIEWITRNYRNRNIYFEASVHLIVNEDYAFIVSRSENKLTFIFQRSYSRERRFIQLAFGVFDGQCTI